MHGAHSSPKLDAHPMLCRGWLLFGASGCQNSSEEVGTRPSSASLGGKSGGGGGRKRGDSSDENLLGVESDDDLAFEEVGTEPEPGLDIWVLVHPDRRRNPRLRLFRDMVVASFQRQKDRLEGRVG